MKNLQIGLSTFALAQAIRSGFMDIPTAINWMADQGADHVEIVPVNVELDQQPQLVERIRETAERRNIQLSHLCIGTNFINKNGAERKSELERLIRHIDIVHQLGIKAMRHDVAWRPMEKSGVDQFESDLPMLVGICAEAADYAAQYGIVTSIENHGFYLSSSERVLRFIHEVNRPNFKLTIDIGNFLFAGEDPLHGVKRTIPHASMIHLKDFLLRSPDSCVGEGFRDLPCGRRFRSTILGHGDLSVTAIMRAIQQSDYNGSLSIEFNGIEDSLVASRVSLENARRMWKEA